MEDAMIQFRHVTLSVCGRTLLHDLNWSLPVSGKAVICGASGSGKTSLLRGIAGFQQIESGTLLVDGIPVRQENLRIIRSRMAFLTQDAVPGADTVLEALMLPYTFRANRKEASGTGKTSAGSGSGFPAGVHLECPVRHHFRRGAPAHRHCPGASDGEKTSACR
jgi:ABC-type cobalamin/Fe3+-siderophores transport systems, ATPase components